MVSETDVRVRHLPDPYKLDVAFCDGCPVGTVEKLVMYEPDSDRLGPYIRAALRETFEVELREVPEKGRTAVTNYRRPQR